MDKTGITIIGGLLCLVVLPCGWWLWQFRRVQNARGWPSTEGTVEFGNVEVASTTLRGLVKVPVFAFSYKVNEVYYSGRFTLVPNTEPGESLIKRMIDRKLTIQYDPRQPSLYLIPDTLIEGCEVKQKMDPHLIRIYPAE